MKKSILLSAIMITVSMVSNAQFWDFSEPAKLKGSINAEASEEGIPMFSADSSILYFVRTYDAQNTAGELDQDIWRSFRQEDGSYSKSERVQELNNQFHNAVVGISSDGNTLFLLNAYNGKKDQVKGISMSKKKGNGWSTPEPIVIPELDIEGNFYQFHVNEKEDVILISYHGENSLGEEDLYVSTKSGTTWSKPMHMGSVINSTGFEISPFLCKTQDTLFFSSNGFGGQGDADIFYSVRQGGWSDWSKPVNLGNKINSSKFDAHFTYSGKYAYWSSNRDHERSDIYMIEIYTPPVLNISCSATDATEFSVRNGSIDATIEGGVKPFTFSWSNGFKGEDLKSVGKGKYTLSVTDAIGQTATTTCSINEPMRPEDKPIRLPEVRYPLNQWELLSDETINSPDSLLFVYELLMEYPGLILELSSHADSRGSSKMNQKLSENRARACYKYLVEAKGIDPRRIKPIGMGESTPRTVWKKGDEFHASKPVDMEGVETVILTESYINKFKKQDVETFEFLHQLNRRTEGRILGMDFDPEKTTAADPKLLEYIKYP